MRQRTIRHPVSATGIALHSGKKTSICFKPAPINTGIVFLRKGIVIPAKSTNVGSTILSTTLEYGGERVQTIEHLMAVISAMMIDNLLIEVSESEIPIFDGSGMSYALLLRSAGITKQIEKKKFIKINRTVTVKQDDRYATFAPSNIMEFKIKIKFNDPLIDKHTELHYVYTGEHEFVTDICRARTFGFLSDLDRLRESNLALGAGTHNAVVVDNGKVLNEEGLRYDDEFVRHKLLDAVGDTRLLGHNFVGLYEAYKPGHYMTNALCKKVLELGCYEIVEFDDGTERLHQTFSNAIPSCSF